jgi:hypothetical protein
LVDNNKTISFAATGDAIWPRKWRCVRWQGREINEFTNLWLVCHSFILPCQRTQPTPRSDAISCSNCTKSVQAVPFIRSAVLVVSVIGRNNLSCDWSE